MAGPIPPQDFVSQSAIFIDMPGPLGAAKQLLTVKKLDVKPDGSVDVVTTIGVSTGAGWREKPGGFKISLKIVRTVGTQREVDWEFALLTKKKFTLSTEDEGNGRKLSYLCRVSNVGQESDDQGVHEQDVEIAAVYQTIDQ